MSAKINRQRLAESDVFIAITVHAIILGGGIQTCHRNASESEENKTINPLLLSSALLPPNITLLSNGELGTLALGQRDPWLDALPNDEDVGYARGFGMSSRPAQRLKRTYRVAKVRSRASFTCTISKSPMCFSR